MGRGKQTTTWGGDGEADWKRLGRVQEQERQVVKESNQMLNTHLNSTVKHLGCSTTTEPRIRQVGNLLEESRTGKLWQTRTKEERIRRLFFPKDTQNTRTSSQELHILL